MDFKKPSWLADNRKDERKRRDSLTDDRIDRSIKKSFGNKCRESHGYVVLKMIGL